MTDAERIERAALAIKAKDGNRPWPCMAYYRELAKAALEAAGMLTERA